MEKKLGESKEREVPCIFLYLVLGTFKSDIKQAYEFELLVYGRKGVWGSCPGEILVEYVQNYDILDYRGRKTLRTEQFLFFTFGYWNVLNGIEIITNDFENLWKGLGVE